MASPTSRTLAECRALGLTAQVVEKFIPYTKTRVDLFGFIDVLVLCDGSVWGIQACAGASHAARATKIREHPNFPKVLAAGIVVEVWSWSKRGARGKRKVWTVRTERIHGEA